MNHSHEYAMNIELIARRLLGEGTQRYALGGIVDADFIEYGGMFSVIVAALSRYYNYNIDYNNYIDYFIEKTSKYNGTYMKDIPKKKLIEIVYELNEISEKIIENIRIFR